MSKNFYLDVPQAVVTHAALTSVIAEDGAETTEVIYWVKNNSQQFFSIQLHLFIFFKVKWLTQNLLIIGLGLIHTDIYQI